VYDGHVSAPDLDARRAALRERAATLIASDHFALLGVDKNATAQDVQRAFIAAAKEWHPDRVPQNLTDLKPLFTQVFSKLEEARVTLSDPAKRVGYLSGTTAGGGAPSSSRLPAGEMPEAQFEYRKAETFLKRNDLDQAEAHLKRAVGLAPTKAEYRAALIGVEASRPNVTVERLRALVAELDALVAKDAACERAFFWRGTLRKRLGQIPQAMDDFSRAVALDEKNVEAAREVRLYRMRNPGSGKGSSKDDDEGGVCGFFKKLFKR
jgi:curved DNA-binding protein CbpA